MKLCVVAFGHYFCCTKQWAGYSELGNTSGMSWIILYSCDCTHITSKCYSVGGERIRPHAVLVQWVSYNTP